MGLIPIALFAATVFVARNLRVSDAFAARRAEDKAAGRNADSHQSGAGAAARPPTT